MTVRRRWGAPAAVLAWALAGLALAFFDRPLWDAIWVIMLPVSALYALVGLVLFIILGWRARRPGSSRSMALSAVAVPLLALGLWAAHGPVARAGDEFWFTRRFQRLEPRYRAIAERLGRGDPISARDTAGLRVTIDSGPPVRVAFPQPGGIIDNWEGVVYDPTGAVRAATGWRNGVPGQYSAPEEVKQLFDGDLVVCLHVRGSFYRCWFT